MPSAFPPPSVERHHSRRRSGRHDDPEAQIGNYSTRPSSGHYHDEGVAQPDNNGYQSRSIHENANPSTTYQDPYQQQATSTTGAYQTLDPRNPQQNYHPDPTQNDRSSYPPPSNPQPTSTYQPPTNQQHASQPIPHNPHQHTRNTYPNNSANNNRRSTKRSLLPSFLTRTDRGSNRTNPNIRGPTPNHTLQHQPSPLAPKSQGGQWEDIRAHLVATSGEFVGTVLFLWLALSAAQVASATNANEGVATASSVLYVALGFGFSLAVTAWAFYRISGGLFNPAVVLGLCVSGALPWKRGACLVPAEILGGMVAAALVQAMFPGDLAVVQTLLGPEVSVVRGLFIEMMLTSVLVFTILMLAAEKHQATFIAPVGIGLSLFVAELTGVYYTGGSLNPVRSFGPSVVIRSFPGYHWIYWLGPAMGALLAASYYRLVKYLNYKEANPGQDAKHE